MHVMTRAAGNWVELLAGLLLWKFPSLQPHLHLKSLVQQAASTQPAVSSNEQFLDLLAQVRRGKRVLCIVLYSMNCVFSPDM